MHKKSRFSWDKATIGMLSKRATPLFQSSAWVFAVLVAAGGASLFKADATMMLPYLFMTIPATIGLWLWACHWNRDNPGAPFMPIFIVQQAFVYGLPLVTLHEDATGTPNDVLVKSGVDVGLFIFSSLLGCLLIRRIAHSQPSKLNIDLAVAPGKSLVLAYSMLSATLIFYLLERSGLLGQILVGGLSSAYTAIRSAVNSSAILGALLGGLIIGGHPNHLRSWIYWMLLAGVGVLAVSNILLSAASGLVLSAGVGIALGTRRLPWLFLSVTLLIVGFLNQGKFVMRNRYWFSDTDKTAVSLVQLPAFYREWADASLDVIRGNEEMANETVDDGEHSIFTRINNLQNINFIILAVDYFDYKPLGGKTYAIIPPLLVPRIIWANKPKTHQGQAMLNLHFGRQSTIEETEKTYIAWGLLPEAVGNFGRWKGPIIVGLFIGGMFGWLERTSHRKKLFSVEGLMLATMMLLVAASYEMVASVFVSASFQAMLVVGVAGFAMRHWYGSGDTMIMRKRMKHRVVVDADSEGDVRE